MELLSQILTDHQRMKEDLATVITNQEPEKQIIEVKWIDPWDDEKEDKDSKEKQDSPRP